MKADPTRLATPAPRCLSLPIRRSLDGVSWASLSVRWTPTKDQKRRRREEIESLWLPLERRDVRPPLYPLGARRFPFERFYARMDRPHTHPWSSSPFSGTTRPGAKPPNPPAP